MEIDETTSSVEGAIVEQAGETAAAVADAVADVVATEAVEDAVEEATEAVVEHVDEALAEIRDVVDDTKEDARWAELQACLAETETRILSGVRAIMAETATYSSEPALTTEQMETAEALEEAAEDLQETEAEVLQFDPNEAVAAPGEEAGSEAAQPAARRRRVRGLSRRS